MNKKLIPLLILAIFALVCICWFRTSTPTDSAASNTTAHDAMVGDEVVEPQAQEHQKTDEPSSASWRPAAVFGKRMVPVPLREFPRGGHLSRRYQQPVNRQVDPALFSQQPLVLAGSPDDGRFDVMPEEVDAHTLRAGRLVFEPASLDGVVDGRVSRVLAPTMTEEVLTLEFDSVKTRSADTHTLQGHVAGEESSSIAQIVYHDGVMHGSVIRYSKEQEIEYRILADGHMMVSELDHSQMTDHCASCADDAIADLASDVIDEGAVVPVPQSEESPVTRGTAGWRTIDVVVGYDSEARIADGGVSQIEARIIASVDRMSTALANSQITDTELMLLGTIEDPGYVFPGSISNNLSDERDILKDESDGQLDTVTDYANLLGADLISFVIKTTQYGQAGVATFGNRYSIVARTAMTAYQMTFAHELGHNLGCAHAWGDTGNEQNSNTGWRFKGSNGTNYSTIMAYTSGWGGRVPHYSNPDVFYQGVRTGAVAGYDARSDASVDPQLFSGGGFDGLTPTLGADNANIIDTGGSHATSGATVASNWATRTAISVITPVAAAQWERGSTQTITYNGGDHQDLLSIHLYKGGALHTTLASNLNPASLRSYAWTVPYGIADGSDYMIRLELNTNGGVVTADSGIFEVFSHLPHVTSAVTTMTPEVVGVVSALTLTFNVPMNPATFSVGSDIVSFTDPLGASVASSITGTSWSSGNTVLAINFTPPTRPGTYQLVLGPDIEAVVSNRMDQDMDGTTGESVDDRYVANFNVPPPLVYYASMDTDPGWTFTANNPVNGWAYGQPTGGNSDGWGGPDPTSGFNGPKVMGYNLNGDYENNIAAGNTRWATTPAMDCSAHENVTLRFQRWFGSDAFAGGEYAYLGDESYIEVSNNGTDWTRVWENPNVEAWDTDWVEVEYNISAIADRQSTVCVRWGMGRTDSNYRFCGWNIDEVIVQGDFLDTTDNTAPNPDPMTFASAPQAQGYATITMTATTAVDDNEVEYYFEETTGFGHDSGWQASSTYIDTGLTQGTSYAYRVRVRDITTSQNTTQWSAPIPVSTDPDLIPPGIISLSPDDGAIHVYGNTDLIITFDEDIAIGTGWITIKNLTDGSQTTINITDGSQVSISGAVLIINPSSDLLNSKDYAIQIASTAIEDLLGNEINGISDDTTWNFTTYITGSVVTSALAPAIGADDIYNYGNITGDDKFWVGDPTRGQTFLTGAEAVQMRSLTLQSANNNAQPIKTYQVRIGTISGTTFTEIYSENYTQTGTWNVGEYMTWVLATPLALSANTQYAVDVKMVSSTSDWRTGIPRPNFTANAYSGGQLYSTTDGTNVTFNASNDRIFHLDLEPAPPANVFSNWISGFDVGALSAPDDDYDGDGLPNAVENYFGTNPGISNAGLAVAQVTTGGSTTFEFSHPISSTPASDLTATYRWSKDLSTFYNNGQSDPAGTTVTFTLGTPVDGEVTVTATITGTEPTGLFVDMEVTQE